jgi:hypothetical protein
MLHLPPKAFDYALGRVVGIGGRRVVVVELGEFVS